MDELISILPYINIFLFIYIALLTIQYRKKEISYNIKINSLVDGINKNTNKQINLSNEVNQLIPEIAKLEIKIEKIQTKKLIDYYKQVDVTASIKEVKDLIISKEISNEEVKYNGEGLKEYLRSNPPQKIIKIPLLPSENNTTN